MNLSDEQQRYRARVCRARIQAVMATAMSDLQKGGVTATTAAQYFIGEPFRRHLELIDLPTDLLPLGWTSEELRNLANEDQ